eukprot:jgi/Botrbrau1/8464/Bobra.0237s0081.1
MALSTKVPPSCVMTSGALNVRRLRAVEVTVTSGCSRPVVLTVYVDFSTPIRGPRRSSSRRGKPRRAYPTLDPIPETVPEEECSHDTAASSQLPEPDQDSLSTPAKGPASALFCGATRTFCTSLTTGTSTSRSRDAPSSPFEASRAQPADLRCEADAGSPSGMHLEAHTVRPVSNQACSVDSHPLSSPCSSTCSSPCTSPARRRPSLWQTRLPSPKRGMWAGWAFQQAHHVLQHVNDSVSCWRRASSLAAAACGSGRVNPGLQYLLIRYEHRWYSIVGEVWGGGKY